jgi:hypothetical protein
MSTPRIIAALAVVVGLTAAAAIGGSILLAKRTAERAAIAAEEPLRRALELRRGDLIEGCERDRERSNLNARGWRTAEEARRQAGELTIAARYARIASRLEELGAIDCQARYPDRVATELEAQRRRMGST